MNLQSVLGIKEEQVSLFKDLDIESILNKVYSIDDVNVYPARQNVFKAFELTPIKSANVVIIGQDPYHTPGQAQGLAFSLPDEAPRQASMRNILTELSDDLGCPRDSQDLTNWAKQGVLLLNTSLTVEEGRPNSMRKYWIDFTEAVIKSLLMQKQPIVFVLWGKEAQRFCSMIDEFPDKDGVKEYIISAHPSPFSARLGFFGSKPFSQVNKFLEKHGEKPIDWLL